ncbi:MAG: hypothetical protein ACRDIV_05145 [Ktedonobacteraceae bacterium]
MKRTFLAKLQRSARYCLAGALLLIICVPLYQLAVLNPAGYSDALNSLTQTLRWISGHGLLFAGYRALLVAGFALILGLPFALFRIIVAQEIIGRADIEEHERVQEDAQPPEAEELVDEDEEEQEQVGEKEQAQENKSDDGMPEFAWRGKGYAVIAAWAGLFGLIFFVAGTLASTIYLLTSAASLSSHTAGDAAPLTGLFAILTFTVGGGLLALSCLLFGAVIARSGRRLWPDAWVFFGYVALAIAALMSGSAVQVASAPATGQAVLSTPAVLLFALWVLWFAIMLVRLKPE